MTYKEIATMVGSIGLPYAYYQFPEGTLIPEEGEQIVEMGLPLFLGGGVGLEQEAFTIFVSEKLDQTKIKR